MVRASGQDAHWAPPLGGVPGTTGGVETSGNTQDQVEGLYLNTGLGTPRDPPVRAGQYGPGKGKSGAPCWSCCPPQPNSG